MSFFKLKLKGRITKASAIQSEDDNMYICMYISSDLPVDIIIKHDLTLIKLNPVGTSRISHLCQVSVSLERKRASQGGQIREFKNLEKKYYFNSATRGKRKLANSKLRGKSQDQKIRENLNTRKCRIYSIWGPYTRHFEFQIPVYLVHRCVGNLELKRGWWSLPHWAPPPPPLYPPLKDMYPTLPSEHVPFQCASEMLCSAKSKYNMGFMRSV